jgi:hypothetical protein
MRIPLIAANCASAATLTAGWSAPGGEPTRCVSVRANDGNIVANLFSIADGANHLVAGPSCNPLPLPGEWEGAEIASISAAVDSSCGVLCTWVVVVRSDRADLAASGDNVWIGRFGGADGTNLSHWCSFHCSSASAGVCSDNGNSASVFILDGPVFVFCALGRVSIVSINSQRRCNEQTAVPPANVVAFEHILCALCDSHGKRSMLLCLGSRDSSRDCASPRVFVSINAADTSNMNAIGAINGDGGVPRNVVECEEFLGKVACAALDTRANVLFLVWSTGYIWWLDVMAGKCLRSEALPPLAGIPLSVRLIPDHQHAFVTCSARNSNTLEVWVIALTGAVTSSSSLYKYAKCFGNEEWRGVFGRFDFVALLARDDDSVTLLSADGRDAGPEEPRIVAGRYLGINSNASSLSFTVSDLPHFQDYSPVSHGRQLERVQRRLEARLRVGLRALVEASVISDEKQNMVAHMRGLLNNIADNAPAPTSSEIFTTPLAELVEPMCGKMSRAPIAVQSELTVDRNRLTGRDPGIIAPAYASRDDDLVRVIRAQHFVDQSGVFFMIAVDATLRKRDCNISSHRALPTGWTEAVWIEIQAGTINDALWEATEVLVGSQKDRRVTFVTRIALSSLVASCGVGLSELRAEVRAVCSNKQAQVLGAFSIAPSVLLGGSGIRSRSSSSSSSRRALSIPTWCKNACISFSEYAEVVARGAEAAGLSECRRVVSRDGDDEVNVTVRISESVARLTINTSTGVKLAAAAANVVEFAADGVEMGLAMVTGSRTRAMDAAARAITGELEVTRDFARQHETTSSSLIELLKKQIATDEAVGHLEETFVGLNTA